MKRLQSLPRRVPAVCAGLMLCAGLAHAAPADWFPDPPRTPRYQWQAPECEHCRPLDPPPDWRAMAALAGVAEARFLLARDADGLAAAAPVDTVIVAPALLTLSRCQQAFVVGHELAHLARRHYDEDASAALAYSGRSTAWTANGDRAVGLTNGDFGLAWQLSALWRSQEHEADWLGSLLAAQAAGCLLENAAAAFLAGDTGGLAASHAGDARRLADLHVFAASIRALAARARQ